MGLIRDEEIYSLFANDGTAKLHVGDIDTIPRVDAVPVVRCEKCLYASQYPNENGMYKCGGILTEDGDCFLMVKPDHFCSCGERRGSDV